MRKTLAILICTLLAVTVAASAVAGKRNSLKKQAIENTRLPDFTDIFNWGLKLKNFKELYLFAGIAAQAPNLDIIAPGDYLAQTDYILDEFDLFLEENGLDRDDIVRIEFTLVAGISDADFGAILGKFAAYFAEVEVKPAAGTLRFVDGLAFPGLVVEYEMWAAE